MRTYYFLKKGQLLKRISLEGDPPRIVEELPVDIIDLDCKINVSYNLVGGGFGPSVLCHNQTTGDVFYYWDDRGRYQKDVLGNVPPEWHLQVFRLYDQSGELGGTQIFGHYSRSDQSDPNFGRVRIWNVNTFPNFRELGNFGGQWEFMLGDFNGDRVVDIFGRRLFDTPQGRQGDLAIWFTGFGPQGLQINEIRGVGNIGLEWKLQVADMNSDGFADLFGYNMNGDMLVWQNVTDASGQRVFNSGVSYGTFGPDWQHLQVTYLRSDLPSPSVDILGMAPSNGEVHGWFTNGTGIVGNGVTVGSNAQDWIPVAGLPQTRLT